MKFFSLSVLVIFTSCSSVQNDPTSNIAHFNGLTRKIIANKRVHEPNPISMQYNVKEVFPEDKIAQKELEAVNGTNMKSSLFLWGGLGVALTYLIVNRDDYKESTYWGLFAAGYIPGIVLGEMARSKTHQIIYDHNVRNSKVTFSPIINRREDQTNYGLAYSLRF